MFLSKPKFVIWPKTKSTEIYSNQKEKNVFSFDVNLWENCLDKDLTPVLLYLKQNKITSCSILLPDDVIYTKSFIYDSKITTIDKKEVIGLAESFVHFKIHPEAIEYNLVQGQDKTIIQSTILDKKKMDILKSNLEKLNLKVLGFKSVSAAISSIISTFYNKEYFLIYLLNENEYTLLLSKGDSVYLTSNLKGPSLDIQKIVNYSNLYFSTPINKLFIPNNRELEIISTSQLDKTPFDEIQIAQNFRHAPNLPLPVLSILNVSVPSSSDIIKPSANINSKKTMEPKKNILPLIAVFIFTAALASIVIWFVVNRNKTESTETPANQVENITPTEIPATPTPTIAEIDKSLKLQVLNATEINGQAATLKTKLAALGFTNITVGNSKEAATVNSIKLKPSLASASAYFGAKLPDFPATPTTDLKETSTYDIVFIIGTNLGSGAATPVVTTAPTATTTATPTTTTTP